MSDHIDHIVMHFQNEPLALDALIILTAVVVLALLIRYVATLHPARKRTRGVH